jgi:hypothetical protein
MPENPMPKSKQQTNKQTNKQKIKNMAKKYISMNKQYPHLNIFGNSKWGHRCLGNRGWGRHMGRCDNMMD